MGIVLSLVVDPFPSNLIDYICSGCFVEMRDLLFDNITLLQQLEFVQGVTKVPSLQLPARPWYIRYWTSSHGRIVFLVSMSYIVLSLSFCFCSMTLPFTLSLTGLQPPYCFYIVYHSLLLSILNLYNCDSNNPKTYTTCKSYLFLLAPISITADIVTQKICYSFKQFHPPSTSGPAEPI